MKQCFAALLTLLFCAGCAGKQSLLHTKPALRHGLSAPSVVALWGTPASCFQAGVTTMHGYPVEIWEYGRAETLFQSAERIVLIMVDDELYAWGNFDDREIFEQLAELDIARPRAEEFDAGQRLPQMQKAVEDAQKAHRTNEIIRQFNNLETTRQHIRDLQQRRLLNQQHMYHPPPPAPMPRQNR